MIYITQKNYNNDNSEILCLLKQAVARQVPAQLLKKVLIWEYKLSIVHL